MDLRRRQQNHRMRWNIGIDEDEQFVQLRNRVVERVDKLTGSVFAGDGNADRRLVYLLGEEIQVSKGRNHLASLGNIGYERAFGSTYLYKGLSRAENLEQLATVLQNMFLVLEEYGYSHIKELAEGLREATKLTPAVSFNVSRRGNSVIIFPIGAEPLDEGTVNDVLTWLSNYPTVAEPFERGMEIYMKGDKSNYRSLFDNLRFALEQLLKHVLDNKKPLEKQEQSLLEWFGTSDIHQQVVNMYKQLLFGPYRIYQNQAVKHGEEYSENEAEFMIYLTGTFMRLLLQLDETKST